MEAQQRQTYLEIDSIFQVPMGQMPARFPFQVAERQRTEKSSQDAASRFTSNIHSHIRAIG
jgi:hypothetical protein